MRGQTRGGGIRGDQSWNIAAGCLPSASQVKGMDAVPLVLVDVEQDQEFEETDVVARICLAVHWSEAHEPLDGLRFLFQRRSWVV